MNYASTPNIREVIRLYNLGDKTFEIDFSRLQSMNSPKLKDSQIKKLDKDEMNGIERLHMQLSYSWLNSLSEENQGNVIDENDFEIPKARLLHFVRRLNW